MEPRSWLAGVSKTVHLDGETFHVQIHGRFGIVPMKAHHMAVNQPANSSCRTPTCAPG
jgi:hypothetical protein